MINVSKIVTISLKENETRRQQTVSELSKLGLTTEFFLAEKDIGHGERGCFNSHLTVCKQGLADDCEYLLVLEDDLRIREFKPRQIEQINAFLKQHKTPFDVLYLGFIIDKMWFTPHSGIAGARGAGLHTYILSRSGMKKLSHYTYEGKAIDKVIKHDFICYSIFPIIADQYPETIVPSDISRTRDGAPLKTEKFWEDNYNKQQWLRWKNIYKGIKELLFLRKC
jgi:GR25 family glycosyltransferase involved in LPS biosynthesis